MHALSAAFSPCGQYVLCAGARGWLHAWRLAAAQPDAELVRPELALSVQLHGCAVYCIRFIESQAGALLVSASDEDIRIWNWDALLTQATSSSPVLRLQNPQCAHRRGGLGPLAETTSLAHDPDTATLYSASGDGNAYAWDLLEQKCVATFSGHTDMLHCIVHRRRQSQLITGSEDGTMRLWDVRSAECAQVLQPDRTPLIDGSSVSKGRSVSSSLWCGCMAMDEDENWLAAGWGAGFLCTVELNTLSCIACLPTAAPPQAVCFLSGSDSHLISVGAEPSVYTWRVTGELETRATCGSPSAFALATQAVGDGRHRTVVGGFAPALDMFSDMSHRWLAMSIPQAQAVAKGGAVEPAA